MKYFDNPLSTFGYAYVLTSTTMGEMAAFTHRFLQRKMDEFVPPKAEIKAPKS